MYTCELKEVTTPIGKLLHRGNPLGRPSKTLVSLTRGRGPRREVTRSKPANILLRNSGHVLGLALGDEFSSAGAGDKMPGLGLTWPRRGWGFTDHQLSHARLIYVPTPLVFACASSEPVG